MSPLALSCLPDKVESMKTNLILVILAATVGALTGCVTYPPGAERGPRGTMAYMVPVEANEPGVIIYANGSKAGTAPLTLKIFGDRNGTFHNFGSGEFVVQAVPLKTNQFVQTRVFQTGRMFEREDRIPDRIHFDMSRPPLPQPHLSRPPIQLETRMSQRAPSVRAKPHRCR